MSEYRKIILLSFLVIFLAVVTILTPSKSTNYSPQTTHQDTPPLPSTPSTPTLPTSSLDQNKPTGKQVTYTSHQFNYKFEYPSNLHVYNYNNDDRSIEIANFDPTTELHLTKSAILIRLVVFENYSSYTDSNKQKKFVTQEMQLSEIDQININGVTAFSGTKPNELGNPNTTRQRVVVLFYNNRLYTLSYEPYDSDFKEYFDQILSTFQFLDNNQPTETIKAIDIFPSEKITDDVRQYLDNSSWPKLKPFKPGDQTREVYLVDCQVDNSPNGITLTGNVISVPNVKNIAETTLKELVSRHYGGFPNRQDVKNYLQYSKINLTNPDSGVNGVILKPDGSLIINFYDAVRAYGGGSSRVGCMGLSVELTMKQFPSIKNTIMCIDKYAQNTTDCEMDFQP